MPTKVLATGDLLPTGADGHGSVSLHYKDNQVASLLFSFRAQSPRNAFIFGTKGYLLIDSYFSTPLRVKLVVGEKEETFEYTLPGRKRKSFFNWNRRRI